MRLLIYLTIAITSSVTSFSQSYYLFTGTYTNNGGKGIYVYRFNAATGDATPVSVVEGVEHPSYLVSSPDGKYLYAVNQWRGEKPAYISSFRFDAQSGQLHFLNKQLSGADGPCYINITDDAKWVVVANYTGGALSAFPVKDNGSLEPFTQMITHAGSSIDTPRQSRAHVHSVVFSPDYRVLFASDLGMDKIMVYNFDKSATVPFTQASPAWVPVKPGSGPRHLIFHPALPYAYLIEEIGGTVSVYKYNNGQLGFLQRISSHPKGFKGKISSADIHTSPDGKFLYASNRGTANNIAIFSINQATGRIAIKGFQSTMGEEPRNFMIDPTGQYLLAANQTTNNVVIFKRNANTGMLTYTGKQIPVPNPACLKMIIAD
jgi:6-phosphogluconolactonase